jgi:hypothetical protein
VGEKIILPNFLKKKEPRIEISIKPVSCEPMYINRGEAREVVEARDDGESPIATLARETERASRAKTKLGDDGFAHASARPPRRRGGESSGRSRMGQGGTLHDVQDHRGEFLASLWSFRGVGQS